MSALRVWPHEPDRAAEALCGLIAGLAPVAELVADADDAQVVLLGGQPAGWVDLLREVPALARKYLVGYVGWPANSLSAEQRSSVAVLDEVWAPSWYGCDVLGPVHRVVRWVPRLVPEIPAITAEDRATVRSWLGPEGAHFDYLHVARQRHPRKNLRMLIDAFPAVARQVPNARLIIKSSGARKGAPQLIPNPPLLVIDGPLTPGQMHALFEACQACVSPHHGEAWGSALAEAMLHGKAAVATAYSGNLDFMTPGNAFLVRCREEAIAQDDAKDGLETSMRWAYPEAGHLIEQLVRVHALSGTPELATMLERARRDVGTYGATHLGPLVGERLAAIAAGLAAGALRPDPRRLIF